MALMNLIEFVDEARRRDGPPHPRAGLGRVQGGLAADRAREPVGGVLPRRQGLRRVRPRPAHPGHAEHPAAHRGPHHAALRRHAVPLRGLLRQPADLHRPQVGHGRADPVPRLRVQDDPAALQRHLHHPDHRPQAVRASRSWARAGIFTNGQIEDFLRGIIVGRLADILGETLDSVLDLPRYFDELGAGLKARIKDDFAQYGLAIVDFIINAITPPDEVQKRIDERSGMEAVGGMDRYFQFKAAQAIGDLAKGAGGGATAAAAGRRHRRRGRGRPGPRRRRRPGHDDPGHAAAGHGRRRAAQDALPQLQAGHAVRQQVLPQLRLQPRRHRHLPQVRRHRARPAPSSAPTAATPWARRRPAPRRRPRRRRRRPSAAGSAPAARTGRARAMSRRLRRGAAPRRRAPRVLGAAPLAPPPCSPRCSPLALVLLPARRAGPGQGLEHRQHGRHSRTSSRTATSSWTRRSPSTSRATTTSSPAPSPRRTSTASTDIKVYDADGNRAAAGRHSGHLQRLQRRRPQVHPGELRPHRHLGHLDVPLPGQGRDHVLRPGRRAALVRLRRRDAGAHRGA